MRNHVLDEDNLKLLGELFTQQIYLAKYKSNKSNMKFNLLNFIPNSNSGVIHATYLVQKENLFVLLVSNLLNIKVTYDFNTVSLINYQSNT